MSSAELHIKDSYFFEVPKFLWRSNRDAKWDGQNDFPDFWIALDDDYLRWEAERFINQANEQGLELGDSHSLIEEYTHWLHANHANAGKPFRAYLADTDWYAEHGGDTAALRRQVAQASVEQKPQQRELVKESESLNANLDQIQDEVRDVALYKQEAQPWSDAKTAGYNQALNGKIMIPQPFGTLKNLHEPANGFCISKFMTIEVIVAIVLAFVFIRLARRMQSSDRPQGRGWNMLEAILIFFRDEVARPSIGKVDGDKFVPLLWTIFLFILVMNLMGMVPWVGAPTSAFAVTLGMAAVTLITGVVMGSIKFGPIGFWTNQVPGMDLPWYLAIVLKPFIWAIEVLSMLIKHAVLGIRLLANMVAGHLVLLGFMSIAFSLEGAMSDSWWLAAPISILGSAAFSLLELFVAFLQAYIFTFLSSLFIGAAVHHH